MLERISIGKRSGRQEGKLLLDSFHFGNPAITGFPLFISQAILHLAVVKLLPESLGGKVFLVNQLIRLNGKKEIFIIGRSRRKHRIPNWSTFLSLGRDASEILVLQADEFDGIVRGDALPSV
jgi:hypothetical protein